MNPSQPETILVGQSGGATAVINASLAGVVCRARESGQWQRILGLSHGIEGLFEHRFIDLSDVESEHMQRVARTPSAALGTGRFKLQDDDLARAVSAMRDLGISAFVYIGGNDSADTAHRIGQFARNIGYDLSAMSVPKTIDNDLPDTDFSPGYPSIARFLGNAVRDATYDTLASPQIDPVKFVEVMGRDAGWVAAACTSGFGPDEQDLLPLLLLPERAPTSIEDVLQTVQRDLDRRGFSVVVVPETMRTADGRHFGGDTPDHIDSFGHPYYPSTGSAMVRAVREHLGVRARYDKPGTAARMSLALASEVDLDMAWQLGAAAVTAITQGKTGKMTALRRTSSDPLKFEIDLVPQTNVANRARHLDDAFIGADGMSVTPAFHAYLQPLLGQNPFPQYARLAPPVVITGATPDTDHERNRNTLDGHEPEVGFGVADGEEGMGVDSEGKQFVIRIGLDVVGSCGNKIGEVVDVLDKYIVVERGFFNPEDLYIPKTEIDSFDEHHLRLMSSCDEILHGGFEGDPDEAESAESGS